MPKTDARGFVLKEDGSYDLSAPPPFSLQDLKAAIPAHCWHKSVTRSVLHVLLDVAIIAGMAYLAHTYSTWWSWPLYWVAQGTMFWAIFVLGHDCGHGSFSDSRQLNDAIGHLLHSFILVPYHGWRLSHKKHHSNHGHVDNDESWHPLTQTQYEELGWMARLGRSTFPASLLSFPFYLIFGSPGRSHSHYHPHSDLFNKHQRSMVMTSDICLTIMYSLLAYGMYVIGGGAVAKLYWAPWLVYVVWLDTVTYLHHHGVQEEADKMPWYRVELPAWRPHHAGPRLGVFNKIHHDIGTHVAHHLFPQIPHYHLKEATAAIKPILGPYYREPESSPGPLPVHLFTMLKRSFTSDKYVPDSGDVVFYSSPAEPAKQKAQ
ncbi:chloroplast glycerolipid omega-3-fatty acid desaturase [Scenedesmus sp. NREL 46B-D3]|nr:chloroplast glycerolipid omega-3-fatty acid desaturase [Scenedesmus sp. NREL 46B-D3]